MKKYTVSNCFGDVSFEQGEDNCSNPFIELIVKLDNGPGLERIGNTIKLTIREGQESALFLEAMKLLVDKVKL